MCSFICTVEKILDLPYVLVFLKLHDEILNVMWGRHTDFNLPFGHSENFYLPGAVPSGARGISRIAPVLHGTKHRLRS